MNHLTNIISLLLTVAWNAGILVGSIWLIEERHWSEWTLVVTLLFFARWRTLPDEKKPEEESKIIL